MAKLHFKYGTVDSAKTSDLITVYQGYKEQDKQVLLLKPSIDTRSGKKITNSQASLEEITELIISRDTILGNRALEGINCIIANEIQFFSAKLIEQLREIASLKDIPVICYGLKADFRLNLFEGSKRLLELADSIEEIETGCHYCENKAAMNLKFLDGIATIAGPSIDPDSEEQYLPACHKCYVEKLEASWQTDISVAVNQ